MVRRVELGLVNGDFCDGFRAVDDVHELTVAEGWMPWWQEGGTPEGVQDGGEPGYLWRPEYQAEDASRFGHRRVRTGNWSQKVFSTFATHNAGLYQRVSGVPVGSRITFSCWVQVWSSQQDDPDVSRRHGRYRTCVGIDPRGGTDPLSPDVAWGDMVEQYDAWGRRSVSVASASDTITVFARGTVQWRVKHNDAYWDQARLYAEPLVQPGADYMLLPEGADAAWYQAATPYLVRFRISAGQRWNDAALLGGTVVAVNPSAEQRTVLRDLELSVETIEAATPEDLALALAARIEDGHPLAVPSPSERDYVLLPPGTGPEWYSALLPYLMRYGPSSGQGIEAALRHPWFVTAINPSAETLALLEEAAAGTLDVIRADSPGKLAKILQKRIDTGRRVR